MLLHRVTLAIEAERLNASVAYHCLVACGKVIETVIGVERALVDPHLLALGREFVLELNMVEVLMMDIESVNLHGQVVTRRILLREGVHNPVLPRHSDPHIRRYGQEMDAQVHRCQCLHTVCCIEHQFQIFVIIHRSAFHSYGLREWSAGNNPITDPLRERHTVHGYYSPMRVRLAIKHQGECMPVIGDTRVHLRVIHQYHLKISAVLRLHIGYLVGVGGHFGFDDPLGSVAYIHTRIVELRQLCFLVRAEGGSGIGNEHIGAV